jgi:hypothetical protein
VVPFEPSEAQLDADPLLGEDGVGLFLLLSQFVFGFTFLCAFPFEWNNDLCTAN